jgi:hypothetical protein
MSDEATPPDEPRQSDGADAAAPDAPADAPPKQPPAPEPPVEPAMPAAPAAPVEPAAPASYTPPAPPLAAPPAVQPLGAPPAPPAPPIAAAPRPGGGDSGGETTFTVEYPAQSSRLWAVLYLLFGIKGLVMIVHALILGVLAIGAFFVFIIAQAIVLFTAKMPEGMHRFQLSVLAQGNKITAWTYGLTDVLPPFVPSADPYPVETSAGRPAGSSRLWALLNIIWLKPLAALPHMIVLYVLLFVLGIVVFIAQIVILVTGTFPRGMFDFTVGVLRWQTRVSAWLIGLRDEYPRFSLD